MQAIYDDAKDKNIANYVFYGNTTDSKLYYSTAEDAEQVKEEDLLDAFQKGRAVVAVVGDDSTAYYAVTKVEGNKAYTLDVVETVVTVTEWAALAKA